MHNKFDLDFRDGLEGEWLVKALLTKGYTVEVKKDFESQKTGNVFIETHQPVNHEDPHGPMKASGINITTAIYWAFVLGEKVLFIPTKELKELLQFGRKSKGGDNKAFDGILITMTRLINSSIFVSYKHEIQG